MRNLYPDISPRVNYTLNVDPPHQIHVEECGNPHGIPVLFVHGGPGAGCEPYHRRFFDPARYRIILFDQRGAGRSTPHALLEGNTTADLVADMERIRCHLGVDRWLIFGGSWGSTLALIYAQRYPDRLLGLILRGIFLCRRHEIQWFYQSGASRIFPDHWHDFIAPIPAAERHDMVAAYYKRLTSENEIERMRAARAWSIWEGRTSSLYSNPDVVDHFANPFTALSLARIECHYFIHNSFIAEDQILQNVDRLQSIPGVIVHGRYDVVCPVENAWQLHQLWPGSELHIIADAGHSALEPGITSALITATDEFAGRLA
jgi:proline iminopeptidase